MNVRFNESSNPVISRVRRERAGIRGYESARTATFKGIATKTGFLLLIILAISIFIWTNFERFASAIVPLFIMSSFFGFIFVLLAQFTRLKAFFTTLYAVSEGVIIGTLTYLIQLAIEGGSAIVFNAVAVTFAVFAFLLIVYSTGLFKVGFGFRKMVYTVMIGLLFGYLILFILSLFNLNILFVSPGVMLAISAFFVILASFNLLIDFDDCKRAVTYGLSKEYEWVLSLGLLVSIVWLFVEILRLLLILASRSRKE